MFVDRLIDGEKKLIFRAILRPETAIGVKQVSCYSIVTTYYPLITADAMTLLETHSPALSAAHTLFELVGVGMTTSTSFEAKGEIRKQTIQLPIKLSTTIFKFFGLVQ